MAERTYDVVVIGGGSTGENVAQRAARGGCHVAVVESELVGGDCSYWACMPSKALLRPAQALADVRAVAGAAAAVTGQLDVAAVLDRRDTTVHHWDDASQVDWLAKENIDLVRGHARLDGDRRVVVEAPENGESTVLEASSAVATCAREVPARLAILGGGVVACEMATAYAQLGAQVTVMERSARVLGGVPEFAAEAVTASLRGMGVEVATETELER